MSLSQKTCTPCQGGIPPLSLTEAEAWLAQAPGWELLQNGARLERRFQFKSFDAALAFVNRVGDLAEEEGHHPDMSIVRWRDVELSLTTHAEMKDFVEICYAAQRGFIFVGKHGVGKSEREKAETLIESMVSMWKELGIPSRLSDLGISVSKELMVAQTLLLKGALEQNPVTFEEKQLAIVLSDLGVV